MRALESSAVAVLLLSGAWTSGCASKSAPAPAPVSQPPQASCDDWLRFPEEERVKGMRMLVERSVPPSVPQTTKECLSSISDGIADHATELCKRDGGAFIPSASTAIKTAIEYCETR
ncbi:MAG: hypothetical protein ACHQ6T_02870 [Myxococcota bacterium]